MAMCEAHSSHTVTTISKERWKKAYNIVKLEKQKQKVRFVLDPTLHPDANECPIELEEPTVDESMIHYYTSQSLERKTLCVKERYFWRFLSTDQWDGVIRITQGKLLRTLLETFSQLLEEQKIGTYRSIEYSSPNPGILECLKQMKRLEGGDKTVDCYRITKEYYFIPVKPKTSAFYSKGTDVIPSCNYGNHHPVDEKNVNHKHAQCDDVIFTEYNKNAEKVSDVENEALASFNLKKETCGDRQISSENGDSESHQISNDPELISSFNLTNPADDLDLKRWQATETTTAEHNQDGLHESCVKTRGVDKISSMNIVQENTSNSIGMETTLDQLKIEPSLVTLTSNADSTRSAAMNDTSRHFLPRVNESFYYDCFEGIEKYEISKESVTSNNNWGKTITEVIVRKKTGENRHVK